MNDYEMLRHLIAEKEKAERAENDLALIELLHSISIVSDRLASNLEHLSMETEKDKELVEVLVAASAVSRRYAYNYARLPEGERQKLHALERARRAGLHS